LGANSLTSKPTMPEPIQPNLENIREEIDQSLSAARGAGGASEEWRYHNLVNLLELLEETFQQSEIKRPHCYLLDRKRIINILNLRHFMDQPVVLVFYHDQQQRIIARAGKPNPCQGSSVYCSWEKPTDSVHQRKGYRFLCLLIDEGRSMIILKPDRVDIEAEGIKIDLPEKGVELAARQNSRYRCEPLPLQILQDGVVCSGNLTEFSVSALGIEIEESGASPWQWINLQIPVKVILKKGEEIIFSGDGRILKENNQYPSRTIIFQPLHQHIQRVKQREFRTERFKLNPAPNINFHHPIIKKLVKLPIGDLSNSGFSVEEEKQATLLPGLIIPDLKIEFADLCTLSCRAQVIYRKRLEEGLNKYGLIILAIDSQDHWKLSSLLNRTLNQHLDASSQIDLESLWRLFFTSGFIYPQKYSHLQFNREHFQELYRKIYLNNPEISRHFTYQERGIIHGHISMLRVFSRTWMIHHYVASQEARYKRVGLILLNQIQRHITDSLNVEFPQMEYIICYFRPENRFPSLIFGGASKRIRNPQICSLDTLAYLNYPLILKQEPLPEPWEFKASTQEDLEDLEGYYRMNSGGLMLKALDLRTALSDRDELSEQYQRLGLKRTRYLFSVKKKNELKAVLAVTATDVGLNLSELTNCSVFIVLDSEDLPFEIFLRVLSQLGSYQQLGQVPILLYPLKYAVKNNIAFERTYQLWVFHSIFSDYYFRFVEEIFSKLNR
jgi:hypothetical protein